MTAAETLEALRRAGVALDEASFADLMAGLIAAPAPRDDGWIDLIDPDLPDAARAALRAHRDAVAKSVDPGFTDGPAPPERLDALRDQLRALGLDGFIIVRTDEFQGEYLPVRADRLHWLSGFSGSAGAAVVGLDQAAIFIDGRYTLQVRDQVDTDRFTPRHLISEPMADYLAEAFENGARIGFDPWLHTQSGGARLQAAAEKAGVHLVPLAENPIDTVWDDQPAPPIAPVRPHDLRYAGESSADKRARLSESLTEQGVDAAVITASDSIAWLLNARGGDVGHCPLPLSFAILRQDGTVAWYIDQRKLAPGLREHLGNGVSVEDFDAFLDGLAALGAAGAKVLADPAHTARKVFDALSEAGATIVEGDDPCLLPKALKNPVELDGTRAAHRRDGAAVSRFLSWIDREAPKGGATEISAADRLEAFRFQDDKITDLSFDTISGAGSDGAIVHYRVTEKTDRALQPGELYLVDSGGQYLDGTTDITRTVAIGAPSDEMKDRFTRVLKGHIAIARARFPEGVNGAQIDSFARQHLWDVGLDFDHGTGHGVGSYLNVHEGPQRIAKGGNQALQPGMILSNEPGYYKTGAYGIRIENLVVVVALEGQGQGDKRLYGFETITFAPIDLNLVDVSLLTEDERAWLNDYHAETRAKVAPQLTDEEDADARAWLEQATRAV
ncbi:MAG: aminopeptidase P family protein [Alphaproteobacteria bacterium]|nr:aminopeptidase P family protein [Alphaproteobacteria bacterium]